MVLVKIKVSGGFCTFHFATPQVRSSDLLVTSNRRFRLRNDLSILVSHFNVLRDERKGKGREDSDPNGIGIYMALITCNLKL